MNNNVVTLGLTAKLDTIESELPNQVIQRFSGLRARVLHIEIPRQDIFDFVRLSFLESQSLLCCYLSETDQASFSTF